MSQQRPPFTSLLLYELRYSIRKADVTMLFFIVLLLTKLMGSPISSLTADASCYFFSLCISPRISTAFTSLGLYCLKSCFSSSASSSCFCRFKLLLTLPCHRSIPSASREGLFGTKQTRYWIFGYGCLLVGVIYRRAGYICQKPGRMGVWRSSLLVSLLAIEDPASFFTSVLAFIFFPIHITCKSFKGMGYAEAKNSWLLARPLWYSDFL